jgi:hypothetical protein
LPMPGRLARASPIRLRGGKGRGVSGGAKGCKRGRGIPPLRLCGLVGDGGRAGRCGCECPFLLCALLATHPASQLHMKTPPPLYLLAHRSSSAPELIPGPLPIEISRSAHGTAPCRCTTCAMDIGGREMMGGDDWGS